MLFSKLVSLEVLMGKRKKSIWIILLTVMLTVFVVAGCSNNTTTKHTKTKTEQKVKPKKEKPVKKTIATELKNSKKKTLVYSPLGDSLSVGLLSDNSKDKFTTQFTNAIAKETGKPVKEEGTSSIGKTATNFGLPQVSTIIAQNPDIVTVEFGTNDAADVNNQQALPNYQNSIHEILDQLQSKTHAKIILMTTWSPNNGPYVANDLKFDQVIIKEGKDCHLPVVNLSKIWQGDSTVTGSSAQATQTWSGRHDNFHPNQKGHDEIAQALIKVLNQGIN